MNLQLRPTPEGCTLAVRVHPGAKRNALTGTHDGALKVSLTAPPTDGRANDALLDLLAQNLGIERSRLALIAGDTARAKLIRIAGLTPADAEARLLTKLA